MRYLLDTAPWINGVTLPTTILPRIRRLIETSEKKGVCSISLLEAAIFHRLGRLELEGSLEQLFAAGLSEDVALLELTPAIASKTNGLPAGFPGDPFDRTIIATARVRSELVRHSRPNAALGSPPRAGAFETLLQRASAADAARALESSPACAESGHRI